jgi:CRP-like cAMP-binding protein
VQLFEVDEATFDRLLADDIQAPAFAPTMQELAELRTLSAFRTLTLDDLDEVLEHGAWVQAEPSEIFVEQGAAGDAFYAIGSGQVDVLRDDELVATLGPGDHFGEIALLEHVPRTATVAARTAVRAFRLDPAGFDAIVARSLRRDRPDRAPDRDLEH